jgi:structural maintenance of chromosome 3 (chondroitin sulfate proteoglycan 6)
MNNYQKKKFFSSHKKDEFFINRKRSQKSEVVSLLESAGFSKSNPYYIVQQGKVANLCVMKDNDRLNLLRTYP